MSYYNITLINKENRNLVAFERDLNNPFNEGFIIYWGISKENKKKLIFKKRLTTIRALKKFKKLPVYKLFSNVGPRHMPTFKIGVKLPNTKYYIAEGKSKKEFSDYYDSATEEALTNEGRK